MNFHFAFNGAIEVGVRSYYRISWNSAFVRYQRYQFTWVQYLTDDLRRKICLKVLKIAWLRNTTIRITCSSNDIWTCLESLWQNPQSFNYCAVIMADFTSWNRLKESDMHDKAVRPHFERLLHRKFAFNLYFSM